MRRPIDRERIEFLKAQIKCGFSIKDFTINDLEMLFEAAETIADI